jgi:hypothetical protein
MHGLKINKGKLEVLFHSFSHPSFTVVENKPKTDITVTACYRKAFLLLLI